MRQLVQRSVVAALFIGASFLAGCGGSETEGATEPTAQAQPVPPVERLALMFENLAREIQVNASCDHYAVVVERFVNENGAELRKLLAEVETRSQSAASPEPYRELKRRLVNAVEVIVHRSVDCEAHADAQAAFAALNQMLNNV